MRDFGFVPNWSSSNRAPGRHTELGYFPASPAGTVRESTFAETVAGMLGADPSYNVEDLQREFLKISDFPSESVAQEVWDAFHSTYVTSGEKGARQAGGDGTDYLIPFHHSVIRVIEGQETRNWYRWYYMLMTDENGRYQEELHDDFVEQLTSESPSNLVEELVIDSASELYEDEGDVVEPTAITPLIPELASAFRSDIRAWLELRHEESLARWMQELKDIVCFHYMSYFIQLSISLDKEYGAIENDEIDDFEHKCRPIYYGLADEQAGGTKRFATEWSEGGIERALYDSWGRLVVQRHLMEVAHDEDSDVEPGPYTLTSAIRDFSDSDKKEVIERLTEEFPEDQRDQVASDIDDLGKFAGQFAATVRRYYTNMGSHPRDQTAYSLGYNAVLQLGSGTDREYLERRRGVGTIARLDRPGLRLFARLFEQQSLDGHIDEFWRYLRQRGIELENPSPEKAVQQLEDMGMLLKQSDGEEAVYVRTI